MPDHELLGSQGGFRRVALTGGRWGLAESFAVQVMSLLSTALLARLLVPQHFGIVAAVNIIIALFRLLTEIGFGASIVSRVSATDNLLSSTFWASVIAGLFGVAITVIGVEPITQIFGTPEAAPYLAVASVTLVFGLAGSVPQALLRRRLQFRTISTISVASSALHAGVAVGLAALADFGAWAIILGNVASSAFQAVLMFIASKWRPSMTFSWSDLKEDIGFNAGYLASGVLTYFSKNSDYWFIGRWSDSGQLGIYYVAYTLPNLIRQRLTTVAQSVLFSVFSRIDDRERLRSGYISAVQFVTLIAYPVLIGLAVMSNEVVRAVFGGRWDAAAEPMAILAVAAALSSLRPLSVTVMLAERRPGLNALVTLVQLAALGVGLVLATRVGSLEAVAFAVLLSSLVSGAYGQYVALRLLRCPMRRLLAALAAPSISVGLMIAAIVAVRGVIDAPEPLLARTAVIALAGVFVYLGAGLVLFRRTFLRLFSDIREVLITAQSEGIERLQRET